MIDPHYPFTYNPLMENPTVDKLIDPITTGEPFHENWRISRIEYLDIDRPGIALHADDGADKKVKIVISPAASESPCYDRTPSFNISFASNAQDPLDRESEEAVVYIVEAIRLNDNGRLTIEFGEDKVPRLAERAPEKKAGLLIKILDIIFPPKKQPAGDSQDAGPPPGEPPEKP